MFLMALKHVLSLLKKGKTFFENRVPRRIFEKVVGA
jgi:hypothetical protein